MKKNISMFLVSLCIIGGVVFYKTRWFMPSVASADFLPKNVLFYFNQKELGKTLTNFKKTPLAQVIESVDFVKMALDIDVPLNTVNKMQRVKEIIEAPLIGQLFDELFYEEFTIALLPENDVISSKQFIEKNLLIITRPKHRTGLLEILNVPPSKNLKLSSRQYGKYIVNRVKILDKITISFVRVSSLLLIGLNEKKLHDVLDRYDEKKQNLNDNLAFSQLQHQYRNTQLFSFFSFPRIQGQLKEIDYFSDSARNTPLFQLNYLNGFTSGAYGVWNKRKVKEGKITLFFNKDRLHENVSDFLRSEPERDDQIYQLPAAALLYFWTNNFNLPALWDLYVRDKTNKNDKLENIENSIKKYTDSSSEELISLIGTQISLMVGEPSPVDILPFPNITIVLALNDMEKARSSLMEILTATDIPHTNMFYKKIEYIYWGDTVQSGLQPVIAFTGDSLYFSSSVRLLKDILDTDIKKNGIISDKQFLSVADSLLSHNNLIGYLQASSTLEISQRLISWWGTILALQDREAAYKSKIFIDGLIQPLLEGLKIYSHLATRAYIDEDVITIEFKTTMAH